MKVGLLKAFPNQAGPALLVRLRAQPKRTLAPRLFIMHDWDARAAAPA
jgi:hypothetical protein